MSDSAIEGIAISETGIETKQTSTLPEEFIPFLISSAGDVSQEELPFPLGYI
jgi:hypothetical protein